MTIELYEDKQFNTVISPNTYWEAAKSFLSAIAKIWIERREKAKERRYNQNALKLLSSLDEHELNDIGISKNDLTWASTLPAHENAMKALNKVRAQNIVSARSKAMHKEVKRG